MSAGLNTQNGLVTVTRLEMIQSFQVNRYHNKYHEFSSLMGGGMLSFKKDMTLGFFFKTTCSLQPTCTETISE